MSRLDQIQLKTDKKEERAAKKRAQQDTGDEPARAADKELDVPTRRMRRKGSLTPEATEVQEPKEPPREEENPTKRPKKAASVEEPKASKKKREKPEKAEAPEAVVGEADNHPPPKATSSQKEKRAKRDPASQVDTPSPKQGRSKVSGSAEKGERPKKTFGLD